MTPAPPSLGHATCCAGEVHVLFVDEVHVLFVGEVHVLFVGRLDERRQR